MISYVRFGTTFEYRFILAIFILEGNTPVFNELLQMCVKGLDITGMTMATISMLIS